MFIVFFPKLSDPAPAPIPSRFYRVRPWGVLTLVDNCIKRLFGFSHIPRVGYNPKSYVALIIVKQFNIFVQSGSDLITIWIILPMVLRALKEFDQLGRDAMIDAVVAEIEIDY